MSQTIYINYTSRDQVTSSGGAISESHLARFIYQDDTVLIVNFIDSSGDPVDVSSDVDTWEFRMIAGLRSTTQMVLTQNANIDSSNDANGILTLTNECNTTPFQSAVSGKDTLKVYGILIGYDAGGEIFNTWKIRVNAESVYGADDAPGIPANLYALKSNVLELDNTDVFTPNADYEPATKKYTDDIAGAFVSATGTPVLNDFAKFTDASTVSGRSYAEVRTDLNIEDGSEANNISDANVTDLTDAGDSTLHYHATDRSRANHTGTQLASTISDFDTEVENDSVVTLNTAHRTSDGSDHSIVGSNTTAIGLNTTHRTSDGKNHSDVVLNNTFRTNNRISLNLNIPSTLDTTSATAMVSLAKFPILWNLPNSTLVECKAKVMTAVSTGTAPSFNLLLNTVDSLSSDLSVNETIASGTIDTANDDIDTDEYIEVDFAKGQGDAEDLVVFLKFKLR